MNDHRAVVAGADKSLEAIAAELTAAAYPVALAMAVPRRRSPRTPASPT